ncbi:hypothetical protein [Paraherbaspirillum soli]|uniref:Uncharacterized protein n=1 Tax=Paraherbaspirillum soli TaxID=631222 RepID=A0ABW0M4L2_9BURK
MKKESGKSHFGFDMVELVKGYELHADSAANALEYILTQGNRYPIDHAIEALGIYDIAAFEALQWHPHISMSLDLDNVAYAGSPSVLVARINSLGRLHLRPASWEPDEENTDDISYTTLGFIALPLTLLNDLNSHHELALQRERNASQRLRADMDQMFASGELETVLDSVIDNVEHVESVCFYVGDRFHALIDRYNNLVDSKAGPGYLSGLRKKNYDAWSDDEVLIIAGLHALFLSGRSVRFEEFNGITLTASRLYEKLQHLVSLYRQVGCQFDLRHDASVFDIARTIRDQTTKSVGQDWLRYRWTYGLTFQKSERIINKVSSSEDPAVHLSEFAQEYRELVGGEPEQALDEATFFRDLAYAAIEHDSGDVPCPYKSESAHGWIEHLIEKIVASSVIATQADYAMSSSLRNLGKLLKAERSELLASMHTLTPNDFYTCFVSKGFTEHLEGSVAHMIASTVQKRMMFNRWHFIPGNFDRKEVSLDRHWYYPPLIPDIAIHADMHRAAHSKAQVKYSIRSPGPDMSRPPMEIGGQRYRGFYDIRVVRMRGEEFSLEDLVRTRRRALWMEKIFDALVAHLHRGGGKSFEIHGFEAGKYLDLRTKTEVVEPVVQKVEQELALLS